MPMPRFLTRYGRPPIKWKGKLRNGSRSPDLAHEDFGTECSSRHQIDGAVWAFQASCVKAVLLERNLKL
jgi:hypothetical protein